MNILKNENKKQLKEIDEIKLGLSEKGEIEKQTNGKKFFCLIFRKIVFVLRDD